MKHAVQYQVSLRQDIFCQLMMESSLNSKFPEVHNVY